MQIAELCHESLQIARSHGFIYTDDNFLAHLMLIVTEVAEAAEAWRDGHTGDISEELADICLRVFNLAESRDINLEMAILEKMKVNRQRPFRHGGKRA